MRISVVVIVYNLDSYVGQAIESVLNQTRSPDEIVVVDDCSTDRSAQRIRAYGNKVRYLRTSRNSGALLAALHGVKAVSGDVVCMLDGDDYWADNKLETVEHAFTADPKLVLLSHDHIRVDARGNELPVRDDTHRNVDTIRRRASSKEELSDLLKLTVLDQRGYWLGSAYSFRKECFDVAKFESQVSAFGFTGLHQTYLDLAIAPFLVLRNPHGNIGYSADTRFFYRIHDKSSLSGNLTSEKARQSALKGRTINELIRLILTENDAASVHLRRRDLILAHYDFLSALYSGQRLRAGLFYLRLAASHWSLIELIKETKRFAAILLLGRQRFLKLKS